jgi:hypothetical protein
MSQLLHLFAVGILLPALSIATPLTADRKCVRFDIPITASSNNSIYRVPRVDSTIDSVDLVWDLDT